MSESGAFSDQTDRPSVAAEGTDPIPKAAGEVGDTHAPRSRAVTWRSLLLGLLGVILICGLTPYNDFALQNTFLIGNYLPIGLLLIVMVLTICVNAPLRRLAPRYALSTGELAVIVGMALVSCTLPSSGLMRFMPPHLIGFYHHAAHSPVRAEVLESVREQGLADWLFPSFERETVTARSAEEVVTGYVGRTPLAPDATFVERVTQAVPWGKWLVPFIAWGIFLTFLYGVIIFATTIVRRQWVENERLAFPLAGVYLSLIEQPKPGRAFNTLFSSRGFWIASGFVFLLHSWNGLYRYFPEQFPKIPLGFNFNDTFTEPPLKDIYFPLKASTLYFAMFGITFFLQTKVAFSLWATLAIVGGIAEPIVVGYGANLPYNAKSDQSVGSAFVFATTILWIGRHHWMVVLRQMVRGPRYGEPRGRYLPYPIAGWGLVICMAAMVAWLCLAGMTVGGAIVLVLSILLGFLVIARVVAETGLIFAQLTETELHRIWLYVADLPVVGYRTKTLNYLMSHWFWNVFTLDLREAASVYTTHAVRIADEAAYKRETRWWRTLPFIFALVLALGAGYVVAGASTLYVEYNYAATLDESPETPLNQYGLVSRPKKTLDDVRRFENPGTSGESHNRLLHVGIGAGVTAALSFLRLRFEGWPFHPIGYLLVYTYPVHKIWFSVLLGWIAKVLIVNFGGAPLLRSAKPVFLGLIIGEAFAAGFWLLITLLLDFGGYGYQPVRLLPG